ncbi:Histidine kinase-, DNA gyrase B-, and HSP90-like ATPase [Amphibacillus marinus]|uniref:histidine kinase n=1 Tax=Amphibacillus marinus TaxID=872970 RepID=A0A1H8T7L3_9BACI|nr:HAMP domain-containing sensor histidine kinase [Amphibacillus marinus]SEO86922.1 Histidine kinase-, DNA gyrase B-, and HSP90-like ATPase [Amphibacillus marinus]
MLIAVIILSIICFLQMSYILYYRSQIREIGQQLTFISKHDSLKLLQTQLKPTEIYQLTEFCNQLLRQQREQKQELAVKSEEISTTIVNLSHDIRTPLTSLDGYLQLADRANDLKESHHYLKLARSRMKQTITLVDELLLYTKLQNQDYILAVEQLDMVNCLKRSALRFIDAFTEKGSEPSISLPDQAIFVSGNTLALERVYDNIIQNYLIHGNGDLEIYFEEKNDSLTLSFVNAVKESERINLEKIFTRFYKGDSSRQHYSSGLGLSIVKTLVEKMGGQVNAALEHDRFCLVLVFTKAGEEVEKWLQNSANRPF